MSELQQMYQQYLDMEDEERNAIAQNSSNIILNTFEQMFEGDSLFDAYLQMFSIFTLVDDEIQYEEYQLFSNITGANVTYEEFCSAIYNTYEEVDIDEFMDFVNEQEEDFLGNLVVLAVCIFTCSGTLTISEQEFINNYFLA